MIYELLLLIFFSATEILDEAILSSTIAIVPCITIMIYLLAKAPVLIAITHSYEIH